MDNYIITMSDNGKVIKAVNECGMYYWEYNKALEIFNDLRFFCSQVVSDSGYVQFYNISEHSFKFNNILYTLKKMIKD